MQKDKKRSCHRNFFLSRAFTDRQEVLAVGGSFVNIAQSIGPHLPYLRRFARALSGDQASGDAYVVATLETLIADPKCMPELSDARTALYRLFLQVWNRVPINRGAQHVLPSDSQLEHLTPMSRQAFLLTAMEGFTAENAALVLNVDAAAFRELSERAAREIADQVATDVLIIEDEPIVALDIESIVTELGHRVIDIAATHAKALKSVHKKLPGLILADIQLADGSSCLEAVNEILGALSVPVIFITAFPERFLTGERPEPAYLLTKPYQRDALVGLISQALFFGEKSHARTRVA